MSIPFSKYVEITSGVGGNGAVRRRDLITRLFSTNSMIPVDSILEFTSAADVGDYFGTSSEEYLRAVFYFGWISKNITRPQKISYARYADAADAPRIYGAPGAQALSTWTAISNGAFVLELDGTTNTISGLDFSSAASLAEVASIVQDGINAETGTMWTDAAVSWNATRQSFDFVGGDVGAATISVTAAGSGTDIADQLGWLTGAIVAPGTDAKSVTDTLTDTTSTSNNFGSFAFLPSLTDDEVEEASVWNDGQNVLFIYLLPCSAAKASTYYAALKDYAGTAITLSTVSGEYPEQVPGMILAATKYTARNSVQNYMFQVFSLTPTVTTSAASNTYDGERVNYYGQTQTAGQIIEFYQRGILTGLSTDPVDMNTYANEMWLKDEAGVAIMSLLLALSKVSANTQGRAQLMGTLQSVIQTALFNGTISVGKPLDNTQKLYIAELTGDEKAWYQVQNSGYWLDCVFERRVNEDDSVEYVAVYTLIYSKDDVVRKVEGSHVLI